MNKTQKTYIDKSQWGDGPWQDEPDRVEWTDSVTGYDCLITRSHVIGHLCGYVGIKADHPYYGKSDDDIHNEYDLDIHGDLTFSGYKNIEDETTWFLGFDCAHLDDYAPWTEHRLRLKRGKEPLGMKRQKWTTYRDINYVIKEVESLARQLKALEK